MHWISRSSRIDLRPTPPPDSILTVENLPLGDMPETTNLDLVSARTGLWMPVLGGAGVTDIGRRAALAQLESVDIGDWVEDLTPLRGLPRSQALDLMSLANSRGCGGRTSVKHQSKVSPRSPSSKRSITSH